MRYDDHDPELALRPRRPVEELPLFAQAPPARTEQRQLPLPGTIAERYAAWRLTPDGKVAFDWIERKALELAASGEKRIGSKSLVERARDTIHVHINNLFTANIARELVLRHRHLQDHFELRQRTAA